MKEPSSQVVRCCKALVNLKMCQECDILLKLCELTDAFLHEKIHSAIIDLT